MSNSLASENLVWLIPGLPLMGFLFHAFLGGWLIARLGAKTGRRLVGSLATLLVLASFALSLRVMMDLRALGEAPRVIVSLVPGHSWVPWISIGGLQVGYQALVDPLSILMCLIVTGVGGLIHLYATGYMAEDKDYARFFTYFNLFIFFMLVLVLSESILLMFVGWEGVGLCSYLLIAFWYEDVENSKAGNKAFIVNRIGDVGFALGVMTIFAVFGTLSFYRPDGSGFLDLATKGMVAHGPLTVSMATLIGLLLFIGATGKSAQFPLYVWLPDAMAGPTPVSALIHAATMVTAGVVMLARVSPLIVHSSAAMTVIASVGVFTAFFAATIGLTQNDIKKVLAYSTVSQLGYMFLGCGVGAFSAGMFHVTTHAFFKALLFLGAGSVIHALGGEQDLRKMGGLRTKLPVTFATMAVAWLAISGIPPLAGFWSKDEILARAMAFPGIGMALYSVGLVTAILTAFYMTRLMMKAFFTKPRFDEHSGGHGHASLHEAPPSMLVPLVILAVLSFVGGWIGTPWGNRFEEFLKPAVAAMEAREAITPVAGMILGTLAGLLGITVCWRLYSARADTGELLAPEQRQRSLLYRGSLNLWYVDGFFYRVFVTMGGRVATRVWKWIDAGLVDGTVRFVAYFTGFLSEVLRRIQTGYVRNYALMMVLGTIAVLVAILWGAHGAATR
ncbi:MAG: NADH-quinone oxidoreductase subunit L [Chthonomonadales bacterium]